MDEALRLHPGQENLTPVQAAALERFCDERIEKVFSTAPVDEPAVEARLAQAYTTAGLPPPAEIYWLNGPLELVAAWTPPGVLEKIKARLDQRMLARLAPIAPAVAWKSSAAGAWLEVRTTVHVDEGAAVDEAGLSTLRARVNARLEARLRVAITSRTLPLLSTSVADGAFGSFSHNLEELYERYDYYPSFKDGLREGVDLVCSSIFSAAHDSIMSFEDVRYGAAYAYLAQYYLPNRAVALDWVSQHVCGYWLGKELALLVRRPRLLARDGAGQLHCEAGKCIEYGDGWGFYAWHGVRVPQKVILAPQTLTARDFFRARDLEVRRVIQERMGERFASAMGGNVIDTSLRGALYEVNLPGDPDRRARYVRVRDASTGREYYLRVPPGISTVDEAIAWTFGVAAEDYQPAAET
jgi:hypothetical protein